MINRGIQKNLCLIGYEHTVKADSELIVRRAVVV